MSNRFTLVTGAAGFIGSRITLELLKRNRQVVAIDCFLPNLYSAEIKRSRWHHLDDSGNSKNLVKIEFDIRFDNFDLLSEFNFESIINEAAMPGLDQDWSNFAPYYECNLSGLNRLLEFAKTQNLNAFVQASTSSVYGKLAIGDENQDLNPTSPYGVSKLAAEKLLLAYHQWFNIPVKILRYFSVYGPFQRPDMAYSKILYALDNGIEFKIYGDGNQRRSNTYVDDVVDATLLSEIMAPNGAILNICGDETVTLNEAIIALETLTGKRLKSKFVSSRTGDQLITSGSNQLAKSTLGWTASTSILKGLEKQVEAYYSLNGSK
jgi:UDP-glucose 4-epimerase